MEKNDMMNEANEALKRTLLMMNYDMKKTLTENVEVVSEQANNEDQEIAAILYKAAHGSPGTDENLLIQGFSKIKDMNQYNRVQNLYAKYGKEQTLDEMLRQELGTDDTKTLSQIKTTLNKVGVPLNYSEIEKGIADTTTISLLPNVQNSAKNLSKKQTSSFDTLKKSLGSGKDSTVNNVPSWKVEYPNAIIQYTNNGRFYQFTLDGKNMVKKGNWKIENGKIVKTYDGSNKKEIVNPNNKTAPAITDKNLLDKLNFEYQFPGDKTYVYDFIPTTNVTEQTSAVKGTWYAKNTKTGKVFQISGNYPSTEKNLDVQFPQAKNPVNKTPEPNTTQTPKNLNTTTNTPSSSVDDIQGKKLEVSKTGEPDLTPKNIQIPQKTITARTSTPTDMEKNDIYGPENPSLKESLKKNLSLIKENKNNLLVETSIVQKRFSFIMEGTTVETEEDRDKLVESVISEIGYLKNQGYTSQAINEGLFSFLGSMLGGTAGATPNVFKEYIAAWLTKKLGVPENSYLGSVIVTLIGDMGIDEYDKFFSDCRFASNKLADALIEGYLYQIQKEKNLNDNFSGFLVSAIRNALSAYLLDDKNSLIQKLENQLSEFLCPILSRLFGVISDKAEDLKSKVTA